MYCKKCGALLPQNGVCLICRTDNSNQYAGNVQTHASRNPVSFCKYCGKHLETNEVCRCREVAAKRNKSGTANAPKNVQRLKTVGICLLAVLLLTAAVLLVIDVVSTLNEQVSLKEYTADVRTPAEDTKGAEYRGEYLVNSANSTEELKKTEEMSEIERKESKESSEKKPEEDYVAEQPRTLRSISVKHMPEKRTYIVGQEPDLQGLTLTATYDSGEQETIESGFSAELDTSKAGKQTVTVRYLGETTTYTVTVVEPELSSIELVQYPTAELRVGDQLDTGAVVIRAKYDNGSIVDGIRSDFSCEPTVFQSAGVKNVTVHYQGKSTSFSVEVTAVPTYTIQLSSSNSSYGSVSGGGNYEQGQSVTIRAIANSDCGFLMWNDGVEEMSRTICVEQNVNLMAIFYGPVSEKWVKEAEIPVGAMVVEEQTQYRYRELQTTTADTPSLSGWTCTGSMCSWSEWSSTQQTTEKPNESDELRIVGTSVRRYAYYHYCNRYSNGSTGVDSCDVDGSGRRHTIYSDSELPSMYINADHGGKESEVRGGYGNAERCSWNYYAWWRDLENDECIYSYQTRSAITTYSFSRYTDWSAWSPCNPGWSDTLDVEMRTVYRYRPQ